MVIGSLVLTGPCNINPELRGGKDPTPRTLGVSCFLRF
jgi:hypothetical protein